MKIDTLQKRCGAGFSLLEIVFTLAILAILVGLAAPNFSDLISNNRLTNKSNDLVVALNSTRQVAISRGLTTFMCHTVSATSQTPTCGGTDSDWNDGVLIYASAPRVFNTALRDYVGTGTNPDSLVKQESFLGQDNVEIVDTNAADHIAFTPEGLLFGDNEVLFQICDASRSNEEGNLIRVSPTGRISSEPAEGANACS